MGGGDRCSIAKSEENRKKERQGAVEKRKVPSSGWRLLVIVDVDEVHFVYEVVV